jgi:hypothetical protein
LVEQANFSETFFRGRIGLEAKNLILNMPPVGNPHTNIIPLQPQYEGKSLIYSFNVPQDRQERNKSEDGINQLLITGIIIFSPLFITRFIERVEFLQNKTAYY